MSRLEYVRIIRRNIREAYQLGHYESAAFLRETLNRLLSEIVIEGGSANDSNTD